jgi:hypothetical protein
MKNYAWVNTITNVVENVIYYDGVTPIELPPNVGLIEIPDGGVKGSWSMLGIGWLYSYVHGEFVEPPEPVWLKANTANN